MSNHEHVEDEVVSKDFTKNWVNSSKFLFYMTVIGYVAFLFGSCSKLYQSRYKGHPDVEIQSSTKYVPEYK